MKLKIMGRDESLLDADAVRALREAYGGDDAENDPDWIGEVLSVYMDSDRKAVYVVVQWGPKKGPLDIQSIRLMSAFGDPWEYSIDRTYRIDGEHLVRKIN